MVAGYLSEQNKRKFTITAGIISAVFFLAQFRKSGTLLTKRTIKNCVWQLSANFMYATRPIVSRITWRIVAVVSASLFLLRYSLKASSIVVWYPEYHSSAGVQHKWSKKIRSWKKV